MLATLPLQRAGARLAALCGYGMAAPGPARTGPPEPSGYGWNGGTGTLWTTDPDFGLTGIMLSTRAMTSPAPPVHVVDFWEAAYGALAD